MTVAVEGSKSHRKVGQGDGDLDWLFNVKIEKVRIVRKKIGAWVQAKLDCIQNRCLCRVPWAN
jgi:hypothetical protein